MSQKGANPPQELVEGSHDQVTASHGSIPVSVGTATATATVMPAGSNHSSVSKLASAVNNAGSSEHASPAVLSTGEDINATSSKIANPMVLHVGEDNDAALKIASLTVLLAGEEKGNNAAGSNLASSAMLHDCDDNNAAQSKLASPAVLDADDGNNGGSKIAGPAVPHTTMDNITSSKLNSPVVLHASKDMDNNAGRPKFTSPVLLHASVDNKARTKLAIQAVSHAGDNAGLSRLSRSAAAALHAAKDNASKLAFQVVPCPHADKDNNAGSSMAARPAAVGAGQKNANKGKNKVDGEQQPAHEANVGGGSGKGNATAVEDADPNLHIFTERERRKKMKNMFSTLHTLLPQLPDKADKATIVGEAVIYIKVLERTVQKLEKLKQERKRAPATQQQQQRVVGAGSSRAPFVRLPAPALPPAPVASSSSREANLADMVHGWEAQQAAVAAANKTLAAAAAVGGAGGSSSSAAALPRGAVPFPAPAAGFQTWSGQNMVVSMANNDVYINLHCPREPGTLTKALFVLERHHIDVVTTTISTEDGFRMYGIHARANPAPASAPFPENLCAEDRFKLAVSEMLQLLNI